MDTLKASNRAHPFHTIYDAFGTLINRTGVTDNNYLYVGEQFDADLGFYYNRARYLNVETGRFISTKILGKISAS